MKQIMESIVAMTFLLVMCITGLELIQAQLVSENARACRSAIVRALEESDLDSQVIMQSLEKAEQAGCELELVLLTEEGNRVVVSYGKEIDDTLKYKMASLRLKYPITIPILKTKMDQVLGGTVG